MIFPVLIVLKYKCDCNSYMAIVILISGFTSCDIFMQALPALKSPELGKCAWSQRILCFLAV